MTRRRIIAVVILLAAVVVAVPFVPGVWESMAYLQIPISGGPLHLMMTGESAFGEWGVISSTETIVVESPRCQDSCRIGEGKRGS